MPIRPQEKSNLPLLLSLSTIVLFALYAVTILPFIKFHKHAKLSLFLNLFILADLSSLCGIHERNDFFFVCFHVCSLRALSSAHHIEFA
jgi:hypothetical protein